MCIILFHSVLRDSVLDCLVDLGLTSALSEVGNVPDFLTKLGSSGDDTTDQPAYTFFAPSNEAFDDLSDLDRPTSRVILGGHIVNRSAPIFSNRLRQGQVLTPVDDQYSLHVTTVSSKSERVSVETIATIDTCIISLLTLYTYHRMYI